MTDWEAVIQQLKDKQATLKPGDRKILDIEAAIQAIRSDALEGSYGHTRYFASNPNAKEKSLQSITEMVSGLLPKVGKER